MHVLKRRLQEVDLLLRSCELLIVSLSVSVVVRTCNCSLPRDFVNDKKVQNAVDSARCA